MPTQADPLRSSPPDSSSSSTSDAQAKAHEMADRAQEQAQAVAGQAQGRIREQVDQRSTQVGEQIHQQASDLRSVSDALREQGKDRPAQMADRLSGYAEQAGSYLQEKNADSLLSDAEDFGRQKPAAVATGALVIGFVAARFLKASSSRRYISRQSISGAAGPSPAGLPAPSSSEEPVSTDSLETPVRPGI